MTYSIVIPVYNAEPYLTACVDSVLAQESSSPWELILVDDGSTDNSGAMCDAYASRDSRIQVIHQKNSGASAARNAGVRAAQGEYILFLDADDLWESALLSVLDGLISAEPDLVTFSGCSFRDRPEDGNVIGQQLLPAGESGPVWLDRLFQRQALPSSADWLYGYRRAFMEANGLFFRPELRVSEDFDLIFRCLEHAECIVGANQVLYHYRYLAGSLSNRATLEKYMDDIRVKASYYRKYPNAAMANRYFESAANLRRAGGREAVAPALPFLQENLDILRHVTYGPYRLAALLVRLLGIYRGISVFTALRNGKHWLRSIQNGKGRNARNG